MRIEYGKIFRSVLFCTGVLVFLAGAASARPMDSDMGKDKKGYAKKMFAGMAKDLALTDEQKARLDANREKKMEAFRDFREKMAVKYQELAQALEAPVLDMAQVQKIHGELKALVVQKEDQHLATILEVRQILTPEQFANFQKMMSKKKDGRRERSFREDGKKGKNRK